MWFARSSYYPMPCPAAVRLRRQMVLFHGLIAVPLVAAVIAFGPPLRQPQSAIAESADIAAVGDETASAVSAAAPSAGASSADDIDAVEPLAVSHTPG